MRFRRFVCGFAMAGVVMLFTDGPGSAHTVCQTFEGSHNGTDMFHPSGAEGAAINKALMKVEKWKQERGLDDVRMGQVRTKCGEWFTKYMLPHRNCRAKVRACG